MKIKRFYQSFWTLFGLSMLIFFTPHAFAMNVVVGGFSQVSCMRLFESYAGAPKFNYFSKSLDGLSDIDRKADEKILQEIDLLRHDQHVDKTTGQVVRHRYTAGAITEMQRLLQRLKILEVLEQDLGMEPSHWERIMFEDMADHLLGTENIEIPTADIVEEDLLIAKIRGFKKSDADSSTRQGNVVRLGSADLELNRLIIQLYKRVDQYRFAVAPSPLALLSPYAVFHRLDALTWADPRLMHYKEAQKETLIQALMQKTQFGAPEDASAIVGRFLAQPKK